MHTYILESAIIVVSLVVFMRHNDPIYGTFGLIDPKSLERRPLLVQTSIRDQTGWSYDRLKSVD